MADMSFREKSAWISFVTILGIFGAYFWNTWRILEGRIPYRDAIWLSVGLVVAFVALEVVLHAIVILQAPAEARRPTDERERLIDMRATRIGYYVLIAGALACVGMLHVTQSAWAITQHLLMAIVAAQAVRSGSKIVYFRRGV